MVSEKPGQHRARVFGHDLLRIAENDPEQPRCPDRLPIVTLP